MISTDLGFDCIQTQARVPRVQLRNKSGIGTHPRATGLEPRQGLVDRASAVANEPGSEDGGRPRLPVFAMHKHTPPVLNSGLHKCTCLNKICANLLVAVVDNRNPKMYNRAYVNTCSGIWDGHGTDLFPVVARRVGAGVSVSVHVYGHSHGARIRR
jgi:hypothetical protein